MANSKNTIQNIPLASELCMNQLRTETKQFQGYNEKNTTLYGGTLSPMYDNTVELFDKDNSYTVFNSKGVPYTLVKDSGSIKLYKSNNVISDLSENIVTETEKLDVPQDTFMATKCPDGETLYVTSSGYVYKNNVQKGFLFTYGGINNFQVYFRNGTNTIIIATSAVDTIDHDYSSEETNNRFRIIVIDSNGVWHSVVNHNFPNQDINDDSIPFISFRESPISNNVNVYYYPRQGLSNTSVHGVSSTSLFSINLEDYTFTYNDDARQVAIDDISNPGHGYTYNFIETVSSNISMNIQRFAGRCINNYHQLFCNQRMLSGTIGDTSGIVGVTDESIDIPCPLGFYHETSQLINASIYYQGNGVLSIGHEGIMIDSATTYSSNIVTPCGSASSSLYMISYKKGQDWYCYTSRWVQNVTENIPAYLEKMIIDGRYVFFRKNGLQIYDIETDSILPQHHLDWIIYKPPVFPVQVADVNDTVGVVYAGGVNAEYPISNSPFVGYLPNPFVSVIPKATKYRLDREVPSDVELFYTVGDTAQSATYMGYNAEYYNTLYPIDPNGNVVLPLPVNAEIIKGYSNNDMVKEGNTVYPLMYWNTNQKTYSYMLLSPMENVTDVFSLQGQQYSVDEDTIYALSYSSGVISNVNAVAYKKNLTFLGTLPTQAVFWSEFNKTFYAFTGDRVLSRMFEASDINKIHFVGQNPSSLSLWICSDNGIYIISDTDMFKLDFNSSQVSFMPQKAIIVAEDETNNEAHYISLYLKDGEEGEMIPVKLETSYYGLGNEMKAVMDCWYIRLFDKDRTEGYVKVKVNTITDVTRHTEEKTFKVNPSDYDDNNIFYLRYQPKYQECVSMQLELETNLGIYSLALGVNTTDSTAQVSKFNF